MKNANYFINGILAIAIIILFILQFSGKKHQCKSDTILKGDSVFVHLPVAYVDADSLLKNFDFYTQLISDYELELSKQNNQLNQRYQNYQKEVLEYQQKAQNNAFLTRERMEQEESRLLRRQKEIEQTAAQMEQELALKQKIIQQRLSDTLSIAVKEFNTPQKYELIFTQINSGISNILYASEPYNVTQELIEFLNLRYKVEKE
ncbi:MAG: OmpH family outer membrane protein [Dysgonamonadaceae bacterium]|jgi:outer membrane protein|nr:OmpH family outer membrane protein [Dysgonamonadaceae bacterium]